MEKIQQSKVQRLHTTEVLPFPFGMNLRELKNEKRSIILLFCFLITINFKLFAQPENLIQKDSGAIGSTNSIKKNSDSTKIYNPNIAIKRSAIIPGWGQAYNKKYWKIPLIYAALGTTAYIFRRNIIQYNDARKAYVLATDNDSTNDGQIKEPYFSVKNEPERIRSFRNDVRQNIDYSVLFFILFWGLNVADAAVDAHLKTFDINDDLSLIIKTGYSPMARTNGLSLVLKIGK